MAESNFTALHAYPTTHHATVLQQDPSRLFYSTETETHTESQRVKRQFVNLISFSAFHLFDFHPLSWSWLYIRMNMLFPNGGWIDLLLSGDARQAGTKMQKTWKHCNSEGRCISAVTHKPHQVASAYCKEWIAPRCSEIPDGQT